MRHKLDGRADSEMDLLIPRASKGRSPRVPTIISPKPLSIFGTVREVWEYRELLYTFAWRDVTLRYKQTAAGVAWVVLQPLLMMIVFSVFLGFFIRVPTGGIPYPLFVYSGLLIWQLFAKSLTLAAESIKENEPIISRVYFPRIILPLSVMFGGVMDLLVAVIVLLPLMAFYGIFPSWPVFVAPVFVGLAVLAAFAVGLWLSILGALYRDIRLVLPVLLQAWMFMTPVVYPTSLVPERWQALYSLNPMVGAVEGLRWSLIDGAPQPNLAVMGVSTVVLVLLLVGGIYYFRRTEGNLVDVM